MKVCRLCLSKDETKLISILNNNNDIVTKIKSCVSIDINETNDDLAATTVCLICLEKVTNWWIFKESCLKSNAIILKQRILSIGIGKSNNTNNRTSSSRKCKKKNKDKSNLDLLLSDAAACADKNENISKDNDIIFDEQHYCNIPIPPSPNHIYKCELCPNEFTTLFDYLDHQPEHDGDLRFKCDKCNEIYTCRADLVEHDRNHKTECLKCGIMVLKSSMKLHQIKHTDRHVCKHCSNRFNSNATLQQHIITIHTDVKDHICETCGKRFSSKTAMTIHLRSHSDVRRYNCKHCPYKGRTASAIYVHMSTHAQDTCVCEVCSKIFKSNRNLNDHLRRVHSREKRHQCTYCDRKFVDRYMLTVHVRSHTGVRPYRCTLCAKAFIRSDGLKEHMTIHDGHRIWYDCGRCRKKFASKKGLSRHTCMSV